MTNEKTLRILVLSDGLPGHVNQSRGLVRWLSNDYRTAVQEFDVSLRFKPLSRIALPFLLNSGKFGEYITPKFYRHVSQLMAHKPDLIVSAGGNTSFLNVALARRWGVHNIFLGSKRRLRSDDFAAHLTLEPTGEDNNIVMMLAPTLIDPREISKKGDELRLALGLAEGERLNLLAVGGNGAGYQYDNRSVEQLVHLIQDEYIKTGKRWLISTSRRTGSLLENQLREAIPERLLADVVWWSEEPRRVMSAYIGAAEKLFVTADSMSMIAEAVSSEKPTIVLQPQNSNPETRYREALERYEVLGVCRLLELEKPLHSFAPNLTAIRESRERLLDHLSDRLDLSSFKRLN